MSKPRVPILSSAFRYTDSANTNIRKTFARIRKLQADQKKKDDAIKAEALEKVRKLGGLPK